MISRRRFLSVAGAALIVAACGSDDGDSGATSSTLLTGGDADPDELAVGELAGDLPPADALALEPIFGERLAAMGLILTDRGGLIDTRNGQYVQSADGNHLALYVEPAGDYSVDQFVDGILDLTVLTAPEIFERWPALESYDICQEPPPEIDARPEPIPATQIAMTKDQVEAVDWTSVTLAELLSGQFTDPPGVDVLNVSSLVAADPRYQSAVLEARELAG